MLPVVELPEIVKHYSPWFESVFSPEAMVQFQRYVSGLIVSENKTIESINRLLVYESRNQSSLNRLLTANTFSETTLNQQRLALLGSLPQTRMKPKGVLSVDDTLLTHYGQHFDNIAKLWDPVDNCYVWAHNLVNVHYSDDQTDYPVRFRLWKSADLEKIEAGLRAADIKLRDDKLELKESDPKKWKLYLLGVWSRNQEKPEIAALYESKLLIARKELCHFTTQYPSLKLPVTFDKWYTQPAFCRFLDQELHLPYVGTLKSDKKVISKQGQELIKDFAKRMKQEHLERVEMGQAPLFKTIRISYKGGSESYYCFCRTLRIRNFGKQRVVINHRCADLSDDPVFFNSNRLNWQAAGITRIRRHRWPVEVYHQEGKAEGLDQYQVRDLQAISRHIGLVAVTYSLLRAAPHDKALAHKLQCQLKCDLEDSASSWQRIAQAQCLWNLGSLIAVGLAQGQSLDAIMSPLLAAIYA